MHFTNQIKRIERIDYLIRSRATGTPVELARKLQLSESQLYHTIKIMKDIWHAPIYYSRSEQRYCYGERVKFVCAFKETDS